VHAPERLHCTRIVATPTALDTAAWPGGAVVLRVAADEALVAAPVELDVVSDPHAIVEPETAFCGVWVEVEEALAFLERECDWELPTERPAFAQGAVAGLPVKLWFAADGDDRVLFVVPAPFVVDFVERWS
jgi:hypothetical protein